MDGRPPFSPWQESAPIAADRPQSSDPETGAARLRRLLLALVLLGTVGLLLELLLLEHTESLAQVVPFGALGVGLLTGVAALARPNRAALRFFQGAMAQVALVGLAGVYLHLRGNVLFERELDAAAAGLALLWQALRGGTPTLAPGSMVQLGLLGLAATYRHPALAERRRPTSPTPRTQENR